MATKYNSNGKWPSNIEYSVKNNELILSCNMDNANKAKWREIDPWGLVKLEDVKKRNNDVKKIIYSIEQVDENKEGPNIEALRRRISFLSINNDLKYALKINGKTIDLDDNDSLFTRDSNEIVRQKSFKNKRSDDDTPGRQEKDFQTYLFGRGLNNEIRTNERLSLLGQDFYMMNKYNYKIYREFPTGVFDREISEATRILSTEYIDILTLNKRGELSVIELKVNDTAIAIISQILDYALFIRCYYKKLKESIDVFFEGKNNDKIICYLIANSFHPKLETILPYYSTVGKNYGFELKQIVLGETRKV